MIEGVKIKKLMVIPDERGKVMEMLRDDDEMFKKFGQVYMTTAKPGYAKGWHYHKKQTDNFVCVKGEMRVGLYDARKESKTFGEVQEFTISPEENPLLISIPPEVYHGFESNIDEESIVINTPTEHYSHDNPDEHRIPFNSKDIPFKWKSKKGG